MRWNWLKVRQKYGITSRESSQAQWNSSMKNTRTFVYFDKRKKRGVNEIKTRTDHWRRERGYHYYYIVVVHACEPATVSISSHSFLSHKKLLPYYSTRKKSLHISLSSRFGCVGNIMMTNTYVRPPDNYDLPAFVSNCNQVVADYALLVLLRLFF